jgi:hypothetical protein
MQRWILGQARSRTYQLVKMKNDIDGIDVYGGTVDSGALFLLWALGSKAPELAGMRDDTPVLTCSLNASLAAFIASCEEGGHLSFGWFETRQPYFIRLRYRDVEIYWLVDHSDPGIWETSYRWKRVGRVPLRLRLPRRCKRGSSSAPRICRRTRAVSAMRAFIAVEKSRLITCGHV